MLITTTGKKLDHEPAKDTLNQYIVRIVEIKENKNTSSSIQYMLEDVLDLRKRDLVPRHQKGLTTIDEIHFDARMEEQKEKEMLRNMASFPPKSERCRDMADKGRALKPQGGSDDEYQTVERSGRTKDSRPDLNRIEDILKRERRKEPAGGLKPQRWGNPQGLST